MEIKIFKNKRKFVKKVFEIKSDFYWKCVLCVGFLLIAAFFVFGFYLFMNINKEIAPLTEITNKQEIIKKERFNKILEYFIERENKSTEILNSPSSVVDPSL